jgi:hypothetical protein
MKDFVPWLKETFNKGLLEFTPEGYMDPVTFEHMVRFKCETEEEAALILLRWSK